MKKETPESVFLLPGVFVAVGRLENISSATWTVTQEVEMSEERGLHLDSPCNRICMSSELNFYEMKFP